jgi:ABC-type cobalt transport system substrate-binding protein
MGNDLNKSTYSPLPLFPLSKGGEIKKLLLSLQESVGWGVSQFIFDVYYSFIPTSDSRGNFS